MVDRVEQKLGWPRSDAGRLILADFDLVESWAGYRLSGAELSIHGCSVLNCEQLIDCHPDVQFDIVGMVQEKS